MKQFELWGSRDRHEVRQRHCSVWKEQKGVSQEDRNEGKWKYEQNTPTIEFGDICPDIPRVSQNPHDFGSWNA
jgi:hypothetical protein